MNGSYALRDGDLAAMDILVDDDYSRSKSAGLFPPTNSIRQLSRGDLLCAISSLPCHYLGIIRLASRQPFGYIVLLSWNNGILDL